MSKVVEMFPCGIPKYKKIENMPLLETAQMREALLYSTYRGFDLKTYYPELYSHINDIKNNHPAMADLWIKNVPEFSEGPSKKKVISLTKIRKKRHLDKKVNNTRIFGPGLVELLGTPIWGMVGGICSSKDKDDGDNVA